MKYNGNNLDEVIEAHWRWYTTDGENEDDRADFSDANLDFENLAGCMLYGAIFCRASLWNTLFSFSVLQRADFTDAKSFDRAILIHADLTGAINIPYIPLLCPEVGSFVAFKKCVYCHEDGRLGDLVIVKLLIPEDAERISTLDGACRSSKAKVLEIQTIDGEVLIDENTVTKDFAVAMKNEDYEYHVGETVHPHEWCPDRLKIIGGGIHFFVNRQYAVTYPDFRTMKIAIQDDVATIVPRDVDEWQPKVQAKLDAAK